MSTAIVNEPGSDAETGSSYEDEETSEEEEEKEPKLKYQRMGASVAEIFKRDTASCMAVHDKFLALGTHSGFVHILDFNGNETRKYHAHQDAPARRVREISIDKAGEFVASCSEDGKVVISGLFNDSKLGVTEHVFQRPITCVALDPEYSKNKKERFVCGGKAGKLVLSEKGWFSSNMTVIHEGEGPIHAIAWGTGLIAWSNDIGTKVWDCNTKERITYIDRPRGSPRPEMYRCCLCWEDINTLIIGWADSIKIGKVKDRQQPLEGLPSRCVEITTILQTDFYICGIAPFKEHLIIMAFTENQQGMSKRPELRIVTRDSNERKEISSEALSITDYEKYTALDYRLDHMAEESLFYLVSPRDIVIAKPRDLDDHIGWLIDRQNYEDALDAAEGHEKQLVKHDIQDIGEKYLDYLLQIDQAEKAAGLCEKILKNDGPLWEKWIFNFTKKGKLQAIGPKIPIKNPLLSNMVYENVLGYYLIQDSATFLKMIQEWPHTIYSLQTIINAVEAQTSKNDDENLTIARGLLYTYDKQFDKTLQIYLQLRKGNVFELIREHNLFDSIGDKVKELMLFDPQKATELLITNISRVSVSRVVQELKAEPQLQLVYLHNLFYHSKKEINQDGKEFHNLQVKLYAAHNREPLYDFLEKSNYWNLEEALEICKNGQLWKEMVFIYGRMGNIEEALKLMIEKVGDVKQAIEFVQKQNDEHLWDELITKSIQNPVFVSGLLEHVGTHINPLKLIEKIPKGMEIIGLRYRLVKIINDYLLQTSLSQGCKEVLKADVITLSHRLHRGNRRALRVEQDVRCSISNVPMINAQKKKSVVVFFCNHVYTQEELLKAIGNLNPNQQLTNEQLQSIPLWCPICRQNSENARLERKQRGLRK